VSSLTRWVLAHKRTVVLTWIVLTVAGIAASGPATDALDPEFSVPNKEGWETNVEIAKHYRGTGGDTAPRVSRRSTGRSRRPCPARASLPMPRQATRRSSRRTGAPPSP
jgi:hypothetical protein